MAELLSMLSGAPIAGPFLGEMTGAVKSGSFSGPEYEAEKAKADAVINAARAHSPSGPLIGSFALPLPKTPIGRIGLSAAQGGAQGVGDSKKLDSDALKAGGSEALKAAIGSMLAEGANKSGGALEQGMRSGAESQALKAAGLEGGITNQVQKRLGLRTEEQARALGRDFLDEGLIPFAGTKDDVSKRAQSLAGQAGQVIGSTMDEADVATRRMPDAVAGATTADRGRAAVPGFDFKAAVEPAQEWLDKGITEVENRASGKARNFLEDFMAQNLRTPGSFAAANRAKSKAWDAARFDDDAPAAAQLYRESVGKVRDSIEEQVGKALGPEKAAALSDANRRYGVAADAQKLADNSGTRSMGRSAIGLGRDTLFTSGGAALGQSLLGPIGAVPGGAAGLALSKQLGARGNAAAARTLDALASPVGKTAEVLGQGLVSLEPAVTTAMTAKDEPLRRYLDALGGDEESDWSDWGKR
jgi:hypothetical protein